MDLKNREKIYNTGDVEDRRWAMAAVGGYATNIVTLDGVILALTVSLFPSSANRWLLVFAGLGWLGLILSMLYGLATMALQVDMLTTSDVSPRGGLLEQRARKAMVSFVFALLDLAVVGLILKF